MREIRQTGLGLRVLFVEDDDGIREAMTFALADHGYEVTSAESAEVGLERLRGGRFHLVITDYALPGRTGTEMLGEAKAAGCLDKTEAVIITAHTDVKDTGYPIFHKPLDIDVFLRAIELQLASARHEEIAAMREDLSSQFSRRGDDDRERVHLVLYISSASPTSLKALRNLHRLLDRYDSRHVKLEVFDLSKGPVDSADEDKIAFTPTLVKRSPLPRTWILGNLEQIAAVADLLEDAGVAAVR